MLDGGPCAVALTGQERTMVQGSCLRGELFFEVEGPLSEIELCHCRKCKKAY